jgi:hypothetical protein
MLLSTTPAVSRWLNLQQRLATASASIPAVFFKRAEAASSFVRRGDRGASSALSRWGVL